METAPISLKATGTPHGLRAGKTTARTEALIRLGAKMGASKW